MTEILQMTRERRDSTVFGAVAFILDDQNRVFTFIEQENKPRTGKKIGDHSVLCETRERGENPTVNMLRGMHEELGIPYAKIKEVVDLHDVRVWETGFMPGVWATVFVVRCHNPQAFENLIGSDRVPDGVVMGGWKSRDELRSLPVRIGVQNILDKYADEIFENRDRNFDNQPW